MCLPGAPRVFVVAMSERKLFLSVYYSFLFQESDSDPNRESPCSVPLSYSSGSALVAWTYRSCPASPPQGAALTTQAVFLLILPNALTSGINSRLIFQQYNPPLASVSLLFLCPDSGYQSPSSSACLCWRGCGADTHNKAKAGSAWLEM